MRSTALLVVGLIGLGAPRALAQRGAAVAGVVRDTAGTAIALAQIAVNTSRAVTDTAGFFVLDGLVPGATILRVRRLGFAPLATPIELSEGRTDTLDIELEPVPGLLPAAVTDAEAAERAYLSGFYRRRGIGNGAFFNRRELDSTHVARISDVLRRLPGVRLVPDRTGRVQLRMSRSGNCPPDFWIDGQRAPFLAIDDLPLRDVQALEVYRGASGVPPEFNNRLGNPACGVVVIWTRLPG